jgi:predicted porin
MKKSLIALAVMAAAGAASAQSSVTLFGIVDLGYKYVKGDGNGKQHLLARDGYNSSRLGFRGTEDLGGGMSASFWLEAGLNPDSGVGDATTLNNQANGVGPTVGNLPTAGATAQSPRGTQGLTFNRRSTVSLAGGWGELRLGRDYTPHFWNWTIFDPFGTQGVGSATNIINGAGTGTSGLTGAAGLVSVPTLVRASNSIGYFLPANLGGIYGQVMYAFGENPDTCTAAGVGGSPASACGGPDDDGRHIGARIGFGSGPFNVALGYGRTEFAAGDYKVWNLGGQWDFGMAKLLAQYSRDEFDSAANPRQRSWLIGALVPVGAGEIRASYVDTRTSGLAAGVDGARQLAFGYVHNLSKRTAVYATIARVDNRNASTLFHNGRPVTTAGGKSDGVDIGLRHSF